MSELRVGARDFAGDPLGTKNKARAGATVVITNRGRPDVAMVSYERWKALEAALPQSALDALGQHPASAIEFQPPRIEDHPRGAELS
jgi:prevent-host-death family protein